MAENEGYENDEVCSTSFTNGKEAENEDDGKYETFRKYAKVAPYAGMPKDVLLQHSRQKKFVWARDILTALVIIIILVLLALVIAIIAISPPCLIFWQTSPIYQIYPKSFYNSEESNGYGDIKGIIEKLDYLTDDLGVDVVAINSVFESVQLDSGYAIINFENINSNLGKMQDIESLIFEAHNKGMKIVMDFEPNHSSDQHKWFKASSNTSHPEYEKYKNYYVWVDGVDANDIPNNWMRESGTGSAWTWNDDRSQFYYHAFSENQPDLNLRNNDVQEELKEILRFWLRKGVDGFRCTGMDLLLEAEHLRDNPIINQSLPVSKNNVYPDYTKYYPGVHDIVLEWRELLDEYSTEPGIYRYMETQTYSDIPTTVRYYGTDQVKEVDMPMNSAFVTTSLENWNANNIRNIVLEWMRQMPENRWPNWMLSNHDNSRVASRVGTGIARCAAVLSMTLPGTPSVYYGDELGMTDTTKDARDSSRSPMQWSVADNAGFCKNCTPWIDVNDNYLQGITVQNETKDIHSFFSLYQNLINLRSKTVFHRGYFCMLESTGENLIYIRELPGLKSVMVVINFMNATGQKMNLTNTYPNLPNSGEIMLYSGNEEALQPGNSAVFNDLQLPGKTAIVVSFKDSDEMFNERENFADNCFIHTKVCYNNALQVVQTC